MSSRSVIVLSAIFSAACSTPFHLSDGHITSTPRPPSVDMAVLACEPVATLGIAAPAGLQGLSPTVSHALTIALAQGSPPIRAVPMPEVLNRLTDRGLAVEYADLLAGYGRSGIPERERGSSALAPRSVPATCCNPGSPSSASLSSTSSSSAA